MQKSLIIFAVIAAQAAFSADLFVRTETVFADNINQTLQEKFQTLCGDSISTDIQILKTNRPKIDAAINQTIPDAQQIKAYYQETMQDILDFAADIPKEDIGITTCMRELSYQPNYMGHYKQLEQFHIFYHEYSGGAHGIYNDSYFIFDEQDRRLTITDLLEKDKAAVLNDLIKSAYIDYIQQKYAVITEKAQENSDQKQRFNKNKPAKIATATAEPIPDETALREGGYLSDDSLQAAQEQNDNFYFSPEGLVFSYPPYMIDGFAAGQVELLLPYSQLSGVIKADYLP